jgi:hypothetical protein
LKRLSHTQLPSVTLPLAGAATGTGTSPGHEEKQETEARRNLPVRNLLTPLPPYGSAATKFWNPLIVREGFTLW